MWVWPQVPLGGPPPFIPPWALGPLPTTSPGRPLPEPCKKSQRGVVGKREGRGRGGKGFGLREGSSDYNGGWGGTLQTPVGARPTSGGSQYDMRRTGWSFGSIRLRFVHGTVRAVPVSDGSSLEMSADCKRGRRKGAMSKIVKNRQKVSKSFSTFFDNFRAGQKSPKIVKKRQKVFRHFSTIFARHHFSGPFWGALKMSCFCLFNTFF